MDELSRKERERAFRRQEILVAAMRVFARKGFDGATVDDIAAEAEFSKGALYFYFKNKEEIFVKIVESALEQERDFLNEVLGGKGNSIEKLNRIAHGYFGYVEKNKDLIRILHSESQKLYALSKERIEKGFIANRRLATKSIAKIIREGIKANEIREVDPEMGAIIFQGMMTSMVFHWLQEEGKQGSLSEQVVPMLDFFLKGIAKVKS
ncbi:MAG TPA: TetR/AcrR family transcriptional regulator [bacterium (Candidatus Stahlbacteria)]|nr:TetR/AcrR family transcriptional regulator [Candidatus Stahlbacteria bacterium]